MYRTYFAHEVYVLDDKTINTDLHNHSVNIWSALNTTQNWIWFVVFGLCIATLFLLAFYLRYRPFFEAIGKRLDKTMWFVPDIIRIAFGASLIFSAWHGALYGPELPLSSITGGAVLHIFLWVAGTALIIGWQNRIWATLTLVVWAWALLLKGPYLFTYMNFVGEAIAIILLPVQRLSIDYLMTGKQKAAQLMKYAHYSMPVGRVLFGFSLLYTAISVKFMDTAMTLSVVTHYDLTRFFPFDPLFVVLGAALIELAVALLVMSGFALRFTSFVFLFVMTLSLIFFQESVWPHYLLMAFGIGLLLHTPDRWSIDHLATKSKMKETFAR